VILPNVDIGRHAVIRRCVDGQERAHPRRALAIGLDPDEDRKRFVVSPGGVTLVTAEMLGQGAAAPTT
jgi:glucose-1-phosphate adenylyltransferase